MKKICKRLVTVCLAFAMLVTMITPVTTEAATKTEKLTLYVGEEIYATNFYTVKSASSSKKSVATVAKDKKNDSHANITAKKPGTTTITVKTSRGTMKYAITVKKLDFTVSFKDMGHGNILMIVKNKTKQTFDYVSVTYALRNNLGEVVEKDTVSVSEVVAGRTAYKELSYNSYTYTVDAAQCSGKVAAADRNVNYTYKNVSSKIKVKVTEKDEGDKIELTLKSTSKLKKESATIMHYILVYDANNNVIDMMTVYDYLKAGAVTTDSRNVYKTLYGPYDHYKVITVAYCKTYNG